MAVSIQYDPTLIYHEGDFCEYEDYLWKCKAYTTGPFDDTCWIQLGLILDETGYVKSNDGEITYADETYMKEQGGVFTGEISYNIQGATSEAKKPFRFIAGSVQDGDLCVFQGGNGTTVLSSGKVTQNNANLTSLGITTGTKALNLVSSTEIIFHSNALSSQSAVKALTINTTGDLVVKTKTSAVTNNGTLLATEAQVYNVQNSLTNTINTNNNNAVHKTGNVNETINGQKTFSSTTTFSTNPWIKNTNLDYTTAPSSYQERILGFSDMNDIRLGSVGASVSANSTTVRCYMAASRKINDTYQYNVIEAHIDEDGNKWTNVITPEATNATSSGKIATVGFVNNPNLSQNVVHRSGNETIAGYKYYTNQNIFRSNEDCPINIQSMRDTYTSAPSTQYAQSIGWTDKNGNWLGGWESYHKTDGTYVKQIAVRQQNSDTYGIFGIGVQPNGNMWVSLNSDSLKSSMADNLEDHGWWAAYDGTVWYRKWKNGWMELGCDNFFRQNNNTFTFPVECPWVMHISIQCYASNTNGGPRYASITEYTPTHVTFNLSDDSSWNNDGGCKIYVFGRWR